ncbi:Lrp/AsnC family transcriptional regulator [Halobacterium yunchengense]|uniref:Lrp/AsnC family transcriptional regulator n=1 Tax=Halobacterium yunchengense TaxID=3108497 RepID=UPI00300B6C7F
MTLDGIDDIDRRIIYALQRDARRTSSQTIADEAGVSASTVRNRIQRLEDRGVIRGYHADVDYELAGYQLYTLIVCTAPVPRREELAAAALEVPGVVRVEEVMTGAENVHVFAVGLDGDDLSRIGRDLDELGLEVVDEDLIRNVHSGPFTAFDVENGDGSDARDSDGSDARDSDGDGDFDDADER